MPYEAILTDQTSVYRIDPFDTVVLFPNVNLATTGDGFQAVHDDAMALTVLGTVAAGSIAVQLGVLASDNSSMTVTVGATGQVISAAPASTAVFIARSDADFSNFGVVQSGFRGVTFTSGTVGANVVNHGTINSSGVSSGEALISLGDGIFDVLNTGQISGNTGVAYTNGSLNLINTGTILGFFSGVFARSIGSEAANIINHGVIAGGNNAMFLQSGADRVINTGTLQGFVTLGNGNNTLRHINDGNSGRVSAGAGEDTLVGANADDDFLAGGGDDFVRGGNGADSLQGGQGDDSILGDAGDDTILGDSGTDTLRGGTGDDSIDGGSEADELFGNDGNDTIIAGTGNDTVRGGAGDDSIESGLGNNNINGGSGNDTVVGDVGNDLLRGNDGNDNVSGADGADTILGGEGNDTLTGGLGRDVLNGGLGFDQFRFTSVAESGTGAARDLIQDFEVGVDLIVLSPLPGVLDFIGNGAFTGTGAEVRAVEISGGLNTLVQIDGNGDGSVDAEILLSFATGVTADDFLL